MQLTEFRLSISSVQWLPTGSRTKDRRICDDFCVFVDFCSLDKVFWEIATRLFYGMYKRGRYPHPEIANVEIKMKRLSRKVYSVMIGVFNVPGQTTPIFFCVRSRHSLASNLQQTYVGLWDPMFVPVFYWVALASLCIYTRDYLVYFGTCTWAFN